VQLVARPAEVNGTGCAESTLQTVGATSCCLQLPGEQDPTRAAKVSAARFCWNSVTQRPGTEQEMQGCYRSSASRRRFWRRLEGRGRQDPAPGFSAGTGSLHRLPPFPSEDLGAALTSLGCERPRKEPVEAEQLTGPAR